MKLLREVRYSSVLYKSFSLYFSKCEYFCKTFKCDLYFFKHLDIMAKDEVLGLIVLFITIFPQVTFSQATCDLINLPDNDTTISPECVQDYNTACLQKKAGQEWAEVMWDANGFTESGKYLGNLAFMGDYHQCVDWAEEEPPVQHPIQATLHFCVAFWNLLQGHGLCLPATCSVDDFKAILKLNYGRPTFDFDWMHHAYCVEERTLDGDTAAIVTIVILCIFVVVVALATLYDNIRNSNIHPFSSNNVVVPQTITTKTSKEDAFILSNGRSKSHNGEAFKRNKTHESCSTMTNELNTTQHEVVFDNTATEENSNTVNISNTGDITTSGRGHIAETTLNHETEGVTPDTINQNNHLISNGAVLSSTHNVHIDSSHAAHGGYDEVNREVGKVDCQASDASGVDQPKYTSNTSNTQQTNSTLSSSRSPLSQITDVASRSLLAFSLRKNLPGMVNAGHGRGSYACLNGIRFLSMAWIILGHTYVLGTVYTDVPTVGNVLQLFYYDESFLHMAIVNMNLAVESFFILSAMLVTNSFMKQMKLPERSMSCVAGFKHYGSLLGRYYFHRYWRLTPVYAVIIMVYANLYHYFTTGPMFPPYVRDADNCKQVWWKNLLYLQNFINPEVECLGVAWYLACDFQFYVILPVFLAPLVIAENMKKKQQPGSQQIQILGLLLIGCAICGSLASRFYLYHELYSGEDINFFFDIYYTPWARSSVYFLGVYMGYFLYKTNCKVHLHKALVVIGWIVGISCVTLPIYLPYLASPQCTAPGCTGEWSVAGNTIFYSLHRPWFALGVMWIIFACLSGNGGLINRFLSWNLWVPLARLTYVGYLVHPILCYFYAYSGPQQLFVHQWMMIYLFCGHLTLTLGISFVVSLVFEVPMLGLEKVILPPRKKQP